MEHQYEPALLVQGRLLLTPFTVTDAYNLPGQRAAFYMQGGTRKSQKAARKCNFVIRDLRCRNGIGTFIVKGSAGQSVSEYCFLADVHHKLWEI